MKSFFKLIVLILITVMFNRFAFSANEQFRSVASGNWNSTSTWEMSLNGFTWFAATSTPADTSGAITVQSPNTVTVTVNVSADQLTVNNGGTISINTAIILTVVDGGGTDLTINAGATISGTGTLQTQGAGVSVINRNGSNFSAAFKVHSGVTTSYDDGSPYIAIYQGTLTIDPGAILTTPGGSYSNQANGNLTNNGSIEGYRFIMQSGTLTNNSSITTSFLELNGTVSFAGTGSNSSNSISVGSSGNVSLANNLTFSPASTFTVNNGGVLNPNTRTLTFNSGTFLLASGGTVSNSGIFRTQNSVSVIIRSGSNFSAPMKVNTGTTTSYDDSPPYIGIYSGTLTIDAGATITTPNGGYTIRANNTLTNNGTILGNSFTVGGPSMTNTGTIAPTSFNFDGTTSCTGAGSYSANTITVTGNGNVTLTSGITFSPGSTFVINSGGVFNPGGENFTFTSGTCILNTGATVSGTGVNAGTMRTQNSVSFIARNGSTFNSRVRVLSGTLTAYNDTPPYLGIYYGTITVDAGATFTVPNGGYNTQANNNVTNNGTITGNATFTMRGAVLVNNGSINPTNFRFDSTTAVSGTGTNTSQTITIGGTGNVSLSNNITFSATSSFTVTNGGVLNPNTRTFTVNTSSFIANGGSTVSSSGTFQTQSNVNLIVRAGANFNASLKVNTGTTTSYDDSPPYNAILNGTVTVDAGATLQTNSGGYTIQANNNVTNNGTLFSFGSAIIRMACALLTNNGSITGGNFSFDAATALAGTGTNTSNVISIGSSGNLSLSNDVTFSPGSSFTINNGGVLNPNTKIFTLASGSLVLISGSTVQSSGTFQTQNNVNLITRSGSNFNGNLKVNTGIATCYDDSPPYIGTLNGPVTIDAGGTLRTNNGGYTLICNNVVTNNGSITAFGNQPFRFFGSTLTNNGTISNATFNFESGSHTLQGTGSWTTNANVLNGSTVILVSDHKMSSINVNSGGAFNLSSFVLFLTASNPIINNGTFNTTTGTVEYNGTSAQSISTANITYRNLRINNAAGTSLSGDVTITATLSDLLGHLNLNGRILTISPTGLLSETPGNTVNGSSGYITTTRNLNAPSSMNVGGLGAVLTTSANLGSTEIRRGHTVQNGLSGNTSIERYFDITPTNNSGLNGTLVYRYDDSELNGKVEAALSLFRSVNSGVSWTAQGGTVNTANNSITLTGIDAFSRWSASGPNSAASQLTVALQGFYNLATGRLNMRDTVRAYLRNTSSPYNVVDSAKSIIDSVTFTGSYLFANAPTGTYYIQLKHRNSIQTWSKSPGVSYTPGTPLVYDFTTGAGQAYGNNLVQKGSKFCVYSGDVNQDGVVDATDVSSVDNAVFNFLSGYIVNDVNGDRIADAQDLSISDNNAFNFVSKVTPP